MRFYFSGYLEVSEEDIEKMVDIVENEEVSIEDSIDTVISDWDLPEYYAEYDIHDQLVEEVKRRVQKNKEKG
jgi:hypothetical protein